MGPNYIPTRDADFMVWLDNFSTLLTAAPLTYGLTAADASALAALTATFDTALAAATNGSTRGPSTIAAKDAARAGAEARARQLATLIQANPVITEAQKTDLGLTVRKTNKTPVPPPTTSPLLVFTAATPLQHTLRYSDQLTPDSRARPFGASALLLSVWIRPSGTPASGPPDQVLTITRNPVGVTFTGPDVTKMATYLARWVTLTGKEGPVSTPVAAAIV